MQIVDLQAKMVSRVRGYGRWIGYAMQFDSRNSGFEPDPTRGFNHFRNRFLAEPKDSCVKASEACLLTWRKRYSDMLKLRELPFIHVHRGQNFDRILLERNGQKNLQTACFNFSISESGCQDIGPDEIAAGF